MTRRPANFSEVLSRLPGTKRSGDHWTAPCPLPDHQTPTGHLTLKDGGDKALVTCQGGKHSYHDYCQAWGFDSLTYSPNGSGPEARITATYDYTDAEGKLLYQVVRFEPKAFKQRRPDGNRDWLWNLKGIRPVLYCLPEVERAVGEGQTVYICEGEKDADALREKGLTATTNSGGAEKWLDSHSQALKGASVVIIPDKDGPGKRHAAKVSASLHGKARRLKVLELPDRDGHQVKDVFDWLTAGGTVAELERLTNEAPEYKPSSQVVSFVLTPLGDLLAEPEEAVSWLWDRTLPMGGLSLLASKPKVGKSTLARALALAVSRGEAFLGRATTQGLVVYLALEEKRREVAAHFDRMGATDEPIAVHIGQAPEKALEELNQAIRETGAALAIIDPLLRLVRLSDANDYAQVTKTLEPLLMLARETGCHILVVHHEGKGAALRETGDGILGSTALFGSVDTALILRRREDARTLESSQRYGEDFPKTVLSFDRESGTLEAAGTVEVLELAKAGKAILEALGEGEMTEAELRKEIGGNTGLVGKALRSLVSEGQVTRTGEGKRGDPFRYKTILVSRFPYIDKQDKQETEGQQDDTPSYTPGDNLAAAQDPWDEFFMEAEVEQPG